MKVEQITKNTTNPNLEIVNYISNQKYLNTKIIPVPVKYSYKNLVSPKIFENEVIYDKIFELDADIKTILFYNCQISTSELIFGKDQVAYFINCNFESVVVLTALENAFIILSDGQNLNLDKTGANSFSNSPVLLFLQQNKDDTLNQQGFVMDGEINSSEDVLISVAITGDDSPAYLNLTSITYSQTNRIGLLFYRYPWSIALLPVNLRYNLIISPETRSRENIDFRSRQTFDSLLEK